MNPFIKAILASLGSVLMVIGFALLGCGIAAKLVGVAPYQPPTLSSENPSLRPFIRLHDERGNFFCSGVVVSDKLAVTANHCVDRSNFFGPQSFIPRINVRAEDGKDIGISAVVVGGNSRSDTAMITGDFSKFQKQPLISDIRMANNTSLNNNMGLVSCGFPWGDRLYCTPITNRYYFNFGIIAQGLLYPGMSGGPVMLAETGEVVAVNTAAQGNNVIVSPTGSIYVITGAKKE